MPSLPALPSPRHPLVHAVAAIAGALAVFACGQLPGPPGPALPAIGPLAVIVTIGMVAWLAARATTTPGARLRDVALPPALLAAALVPDLSAAALIPALALSLNGARSTHVIAILVRCSALAALLFGVAGAAGIAGNGVAFVFILLACGFSLRRSHPAAANDNPLLVRETANPWLPPVFPHVTFAGESNPGNWGVSHVQQPHA